VADGGSGRRLTGDDVAATRGVSESIIAIEAYDHVALPAADCEAMLEFYRALGFAVVGEKEWRDGTMPVVAVAIGNSKINLHDPKLWKNPRFKLKGPTAQPGCGDLCFVWKGTVEEASALITAAGGEIVTGPVGRVGGRDAGTALGRSVYTRDPDGNLIELITYD
jgi:catechol 2,3-dioxygenase-like lactoylglutathione lyase family enzyme